MEFLWNGLLSITWQQAVMYAVGLLLIYLAIEKDYEPGEHPVQRRFKPDDGGRGRDSRYRTVAV